MGVYEVGEHYCAKCKKKTQHDIGWESEEPERLDLKCHECKYERFE